MTRVATRNSEPPPVRLAAMGALYAIEGAALVCAMVVYKNGDRPFLVLFTGQHAPAFIGGILAVVGAGAYLALSYRRTVIAQRRRFWMTVAINAVTVMLLLAFGEATVRVLSSRTSLGIRFANTLLLPRSWDATKARNQALLDKAPTDVSYLIADASLGWTVAPSRQSRDGLYSSSAEGARSARPGTSYALDTPHPRIALVGDSFTFGLEVGFEDSWGARLQRGLDSQVHVLNFGVDGYGVDQAYLRYVKDVRPWRPDVVILGFINHDLDRSMVAYTFVSFPEWELPFAKPRFVVNTGRLELRNTPVPSPEAILMRRSVHDLPFVELDPGYAPHEWAWRPYHHSYLVRFLLSKFPRWPQPSAEASDKAAELVNREILTSFARVATAHGSIPLIVYFPSRSDFRGDNRDLKLAILGELRQRGVVFHDLTACLAEVGPTALFLEAHYSPAGNAAVAQCLVPIVEKHVTGRRYRPEPPR